MLLPGPEAQQLATYLGWRLHGIRGGIAAGTLFVLPAAFLLWVLSLLYVVGRDWSLLHAFFEGLKPAVVAIVAAALWKIGRRTVTTLPLALIALTALALILLHSPYPAVVLGFGLLGFFFLRRQGREDFPASASEERRDWRGSIRVTLSVLVVWIVPMAGLFLWIGPKALPVKVGLFFGKVALFSFGGAYAALSYVSLHASSDWGWVTPGQMMDGLGLAETTPGPLLIALQFVAFVACYHSPGVLSPLLAATLGSLAAVWSLFLPSFLWIFALAPHMERISRNRGMAGALSAIGAVVTAVIASLALWFAKGLFFQSSSNNLIYTQIFISFISYLALTKTRLGMIPVILLAGCLGVLLKISAGSI
jgi:chromate transporter